MTDNEIILEVALNAGYTLVKDDKPSFGWSLWYLVDRKGRKIDTFKTGPNYIPTLKERPIGNFPRYTESKDAILEVIEHLPQDLWLDFHFFLGKMIPEITVTSKLDFNVQKLITASPRLYCLAFLSTLKGKLIQ